MELTPSSIFMHNAPFSSMEEGTTDGSSSPSGKPQKPRKWRRVKKKKDEAVPTEIVEIPGVKKLVISSVVQKVINCIAGEHVTAENPWKYVTKEILEENLELHEESSEFLPIKAELLSYPTTEILIIYMPSESRPYDEFCVCVTKAAEEAVLKIIEDIRIQREERLNKSVVKTAGTWKSFGSEREIEDIRVKLNRPLLEVEVESDYPIAIISNRFKLRYADDVRDGYVDILYLDKTFTYILRRRIDASTQVTPMQIENHTQTIYPYPKSTYVQYQYEYKPVGFTETTKKTINSFLNDKLGNLSDLLYVNKHINFYTSDYSELFKHSKKIAKRKLKYIIPYTSFMDPIICKKKEICCHTWHPMWTGTVAIGYANHKLSDYIKRTQVVDEVKSAIYDVTPVLLWSFKDNLHPRLLLETPREISALSFSPYDENILIGGCINGQIIIWDITNKLKNVEEEEILTVEQVGYRQQMKSLVSWMKYTKNPKVVKPAVISQLEYSHTTIVTDIKWICPYREITKSGLLVSIPDDENRTSHQFMTSSKDGTVLAWDLNSKPASFDGSYKPQRKLKRLKQRPAALIVEDSPLRPLNRLFKPVFKIIVLAPNSARNLPVTRLDLRVPKINYEEIHPDPKRKFNITDRILYRPRLERSTYPLANHFVAGSVEGDFLVASWEGFEFNSGEVVNKETCVIQNFAKFHDGPIFSIARSPLLTNIVLTVGGTIFAIWKIDFIGRPIMWRRLTTSRYTHGIWNTFRPTMFRLCRADGVMEMWYLKSRSDRYIITDVVSGYSLGQTSSHPRLMKQNVIAFVGSRSNFMLYFVANSLIKRDQGDLTDAQTFFDKEIERKTKFLKWQQEWTQKYSNTLKLEKARQTDNQEALEGKQSAIPTKLDDGIEVKQENLQSICPEPGKFSEWAQNQWIAKEKERMRSVVLGKKFIDIDLLEKQQMPLLEESKAEESKRKRQEVRHKMGQKIFEDSVSMLFPDSRKRKSIPSLDPYAGDDIIETKVQVFEEYLKITDKCEELINKQKYVYCFDWLKLKATGRERRRILDGYYIRNNHKDRLVREKEQIELGLWDIAKKTISEESIGGYSIDEEALTEEIDIRS